MVMAFLSGESCELIELQMLIMYKMGQLGSSQDNRTWSWMFVSGESCKIIELQMFTLII